MKPFHLLLEARPFCVFDRSAMEKLEKSDLIITDMRGSGVGDPAFMEAAGNAHAVLCGNDLVVDEAFLNTAPNLKAVSKFGVGLDTVDVEAATRHKVAVFNTPGANKDAVADHTFALMLSVARKIIPCDSGLREKRWEHTKIMGVEIWKKTLGLMGLGAIGRSVALRAKGFQMEIAACDPFWPEEFARENDIRRVELEELLKISDILSIHSPLTPENKGIIDQKAFETMKASAFLINAARGGIVNEADLFAALENKTIAGAGIDVFDEEPPVSSPLLKLDNVVLTPHTAAFTHEAMNNMSMGAADQALEFFSGKKPAHMVNPDVFTPV
ncbi:conserved hypothetical protein [Candidatus Desulfarcum epimagneticum]|uniref:Uncharacterized protein n=1 Tax=uncultured Desulfobacteraceae bacterium TaxID=218296 RepID=A0A484HFW9_9BACT|nr:conserved hypothetical protein [uncultured Desulfobacteraceae bacterium]